MISGNREFYNTIAYDFDFSCIAQAGGGTQYYYCTCLIAIVL